MTLRKKLKKRSKISDAHTDNKSIDTKQPNITQKPSNENLDTKEVLSIPTPQPETKIESKATTEPLKPKTKRPTTLAEIRAYREAKRLERTKNK